MMDRAAPVEAFPVSGQESPIGSLLQYCLILPAADETFHKAGLCITRFAGTIFRNHHRSSDGFPDMR